MRARNVFAAVACVASLLWTGCRTTATPTPAPTPVAVAAAEPPLVGQTECTTCHRAEGAEWSASMHRVSFTDKDFQTSFALEPEQFCFGCHAPLAKDRADARGAALGTGCTSCHQVAPGHVEGRTTVATTTDCAGCHEFAFPHQKELMQSTLREHAASPFAGRACTSCHMTRARDGHRDHRFDVSRNEALLRAAIHVKTRRTAAGIAVDLTTQDVGHAMPTGDLFRRMLVVVRSESATGEPLGEDDVVLGRRFERRPGFTTEREDTRVFGTRTVAVDGEWLTAAARITIEVRYERVGQTADYRDSRGDFQHRDRLFASVLLAEAELGKSSPLTP